ncbi:MAG: sigma-70 family RNA polymerase sigma factor [Candidatus Zixiibacteriota bacterium]|nr:MAG: sigma-70 family RNA polymerase sigma factor [candidate division Zixibacteria bacterium]
MFLKLPPADVRDTQKDFAVQVPSRTSQNTIERFEKIALVHSGFMLNLARKLTGNEAHAEDLYQDTYFKAFRSFESFNGESRCRAWLKKIMINTFINMYNRRQKVVFCHKDDEAFNQFPAEPLENQPDCERSDHDSLLRELVSDEVKKSLMLLPESYRTVVIMYDMLGFSYKEVARKVQAPMGTIKSRLFRGRTALKENLQQYYNEFNGGNDLTG